MSDSGRPLFYSALSSSSLLEVRTNEVKGVIFPESSKPGLWGIGSAGLSACSLVIILSKHAAIAAHVGPNEVRAADDDIESPKRLAYQKMSEIETMYNSYRQYFSDDTRTYIICARFGNQIPSQFQAEIFRECLRRMDLPTPDTQISYRGGNMDRLGLLNSNSSEGTWLVDGRPELSFPRVYLEDVDISPYGTQKAVEALNGEASDSVDDLLGCIANGRGFPPIEVVSRLEDPALEILRY